VSYLSETQVSSADIDKLQDDCLAAVRAHGRDGELGASLFLPRAQAPVYAPSCVLRRASFTSQSARNTILEAQLEEMRRLLLELHDEHAATKSALLSSKVSLAFHLTRRPELDPNHGRHGDDDHDHEKWRGHLDDHYSDADSQREKLQGRIAMRLLLASHKTAGGLPPKAGAGADAGGRATALEKETLEKEALALAASNEDLVVQLEALKKKLAAALDAAADSAAKATAKVAAAAAAVDQGTGRGGGGGVGNGVGGGDGWDAGGGSGGDGSGAGVAMMDTDLKSKSGGDDGDGSLADVRFFFSHSTGCGAASSWGRTLTRPSALFCLYVARKL